MCTAPTKQQPHPHTPVYPYPPWEGDTSSLLPGSAHSFPGSPLPPQSTHFSLRPLNPLQHHWKGSAEGDVLVQSQGGAANQHHIG